MEYDVSRKPRVYARWRTSGTMSPAFERLMNRLFIDPAGHTADNPQDDDQHDEDRFQPPSDDDPAFEMDP